MYSYTDVTRVSQGVNAKSRHHNQKKAAAVKNSTARRQIYGAGGADGHSSARWNSVEQDFMTYPSLPGLMGSIMLFLSVRFPTGVPSLHPLTLCHGRVSAYFRKIQLPVTSFGNLKSNKGRGGIICHPPTSFFLIRAPCLEYTTGECLFCLCIMLVNKTGFNTNVDGCINIKW